MVGLEPRRKQVGKTNCRIPAEEYYGFFCPLAFCEGLLCCLVNKHGSAIPTSFLSWVSPFPLRCRSWWVHVPACHSSDTHILRSIPFSSQKVSRSDHNVIPLYWISFLFTHFQNHFSSKFFALVLALLPGKCKLILMGD